MPLSRAPQPARDRSGADVRHGVFEETHSYDFAAADVFSLGCALGELFLDGSALFDLSQLLAYRRGEHDRRGRSPTVRPPREEDTADDVKMERKDCGIQFSASTRCKTNLQRKPCGRRHRRGQHHGQKDPKV